jgi:hypothetical protein
MAKMYKTAQGRVLDMDRLRLLHERESAVGNMGVNARGDQIDQYGNIVKSRNDIIKDRYNQRGTNESK